MNAIIKPNLKQAVPFFMVKNMQASLDFYVTGLGFEIKNKWTPRGTIEWCWLQRGDTAIMLQEFRKEARGVTGGAPVGEGVSICFICEDAIALYHEFISREIEATRPFVGNGMWVTSLRDPDGYQLAFESYTDAAEETEYSEHQPHG